MNPNQNQTPNSSQPTQTPPPPLQPLSPTQPPVVPLSPADFEKHDYTHPIVDTPKHIYHPKRFILWLSIAVVVSILAVATMLLIALLPPQGSKTSSDTEKPQQTSSNSKPVTAELAITHIKDQFKGTEQAKSPILRPVQAPSMAYFTVVPDTAPLISVAGEVAPSKAQAQLDSIVHSFIGDKFTKTVISDGTNSTNYQAYFTNSAAICELDQLNTKDTKANVWIEAKCLDISVYASYAAAQQPLVTLYTPLSATSVQYGFVGKPTVTPASTAGYQRAQLQVSTIISSQMTSNGQFALYYQTPDGIWHYFNDQDNNVPIDCAQYSSKDLQSAYANTPCRNIQKGTVSTVPAPRPGAR